MMSLGCGSLNGLSGTGTMEHAAFVLRPTTGGTGKALVALQDAFGALLRLLGGDFEI
jgi:hypothetical protein